MNGMDGHSSAPALGEVRVPVYAKHHVHPLSMGISGKPIHKFPVVRPQLSQVLSNVSVAFAESIESGALDRRVSMRIT